MKRKSRKIALGIAVLLLLIQLIPVSRDNPTVVPTQDFIQVERPPDAIAQQLQRSCYDCHSHHTQWPWYAYVAPVSWFVANHVHEGREKVNFSTWGTLSPRKRDHAIEEIIEYLDNEKMPLYSYTLIHSDARLDDQKRSALIAYFKSLYSDED